MTFLLTLRIAVIEDGISAAAAAMAFLFYTVLLLILLGLEFTRFRFTFLWSGTCEVTSSPSVI